jgi:hypothetical protein
MRGAAGASAMAGYVNHSKSSLPAMVDARRAQQKAEVWMQGTPRTIRPRRGSYGLPKVAMRSMRQTNSTRFSLIAGSRRA